MRQSKWQHFSELLLVYIFMKVLYPRSFNKVNMSFLKRLWPYYRGVCARRLVQEHSKLHCLKINTIQQRAACSGSDKPSWRVSQQAHNPSNCVRITPTSISYTFLVIILLPLVCWNTLTRLGLAERTCEKRLPDGLWRSLIFSRSIFLWTFMGIPTTGILIPA